MSQTTRDVHFTTAHIPSKGKWKIWFLRILIIGIIMSILFFPYQIGHFIGSWVNAFLNGINLN